MPIRGNMDKELAEDIYWVLEDKPRFASEFCCDKENYLRLKKERVKISTRYSELKSENSFSEAQRIATVEWLTNYERECPKEH